MIISYNSLEAEIQSTTKERHHHWLDGQEFEQRPEFSGGQRSLACCSPLGCKSGTWLSDWTTTKEGKREGWCWIGNWWTSNVSLFWLASMYQLLLEFLLRLSEISAGYKSTNRPELLPLLHHIFSSLSPETPFHPGNSYCPWITTLPWKGFSDSPSGYSLTQGSHGPLVFL